MAVGTCTSCRSVLGSVLRNGGLVFLGRLFFCESLLMMASPRRRIIILGLLACTSASLLMPPLCHWLFQCGCSWLWTLAATQCNVHNSLPPHCPWCSHGNAGYYLPYLGFIFGQFACGWAVLRFTRIFWLAVTATLVSIFPIGALLGIVTVNLVQYPYFILR